MYQSSGQFGVSDGGASPDVVFGRETEKCLVVMRKLRAARVTHVVGGARNRLAAAHELATQSSATCRPRQAACSMRYSTVFEENVRAVRCRRKKGPSARKSTGVSAGR